MCVLFVDSLCVCVASIFSRSFFFVVDILCCLFDMFCCWFVISFIWFVSQLSLTTIVLGGCWRLGVDTIFFFIVLPFAIMLMVHICYASVSVFIRCC